MLTFARLPSISDILAFAVKLAANSYGPSCDTVLFVNERTYTCSIAFEHSECMKSSTIRLFLFNSQDSVSIDVNTIDY